MTFVIKIIDPEFYNYSNLLLEDNNRKIYYFNNLILSPEHRINLEPKTLTPETLEYLFSRPRTNINGPVYHYHLLPGVTARIEVFREAPPLAKPMVKQMVQNADKEEAVLQLPLHHLPSGWHRIKITNADTGSPLEESTFYLNTDGWGQDTLAIVELFGRIGDDDYALLNADGTWKWEENAEEAPGALLPARFELRIENRSTIWRYIDSKTHDTKHETELKPLTSNGYIPISPEGQLLPNPSARMIKILDNGDACSEIFI